MGEVRSPASPPRGRGSWVCALGPGQTTGFSCSVNVSRATPHPLGRAVLLPPSRAPHCPNHSSGRDRWGRRLWGSRAVGAFPLWGPPLSTAPEQPGLAGDAGGSLQLHALSPVAQARLSRGRPPLAERSPTVTNDPLAC